jgi:hypothetical protein
LTLSKGDITKREEILWGYGIKEVQPYLEFIGREILFREAIIKVLGVGEKGKSANLQDSFCVACKIANKDIDCEHCSKTVVQVKESG